MDASEVSVSVRLAAPVADLEIKDWLLLEVGDGEKVRLLAFQKFVTDVLDQQGNRDYLDLMYWSTTSASISPTSCM
jgi:hypothetical protein